MKNLVYIVLTSLLLFSCELKDIDFEGVESYKLEKFENNEAILNLSIKILNENWFKLKIKPSKLNVSVDGFAMGILYLDKKVKIKGKRSAVYDTKVRFKFNDGAIMKMIGLASKKEIKVNFEGKIKGGVFFFSKKIKINETKTISPQELNLNLFNN